MEFVDFYLLLIDVNMVEAELNWKESFISMGK